MAYLLVDIDGVHRHVSQALIVNRMIQANGARPLEKFDNKTSGQIYHAIQHAGLHSMQDTATVFFALGKLKVNVAEFARHCEKNPENASIAIEQMLTEASVSEGLKQKLAEDYRRFSVPQTLEDMKATPFHHLKTILKLLKQKLLCRIIN